MSAHLRHVRKILKPSLLKPEASFFSRGSIPFMNSETSDYSQWSVERLAERVRALEKELRDANAKYQASSQPKRLPTPGGARERKNRARRAFDYSKYTTRHIALKFAYLGRRYNGYEYHANNVTPLPTVEEQLWKALVKGRLILPTDIKAVEAGKVTWEGCDYTKCGRTDRGVSAFGQVIGIRVRSNRPRSKEEVSTPKTELEESASHEEPAEAVLVEEERHLGREIEKDNQQFDPIRDEIPYVQALNRLLPADIRALAWCPNPPTDFSARFSCRERRYRYFFTQPAFNPTFAARGLSTSFTVDRSTGQKRREGWLDIESMKEAAKRFEGLHDFRNFCKYDAAKQIHNFRRRIFRSEIVEVDPTSESAAFIAGSSFAELENSPALLANGTRQRGLQIPAPKIYQFILHGSAFLWHQVRHMVAILFLIGQGLEKPELVSQLLDTELTPTKPVYEMAADRPLVLWDCVFPSEGSTAREDALNWIWVGDEPGVGDERSEVTSGFRGLGKFGTGGLVDDVWELWREKKIDELLAGSLLNLAVSQGRNSEPAIGEPTAQSQKMFLGGDTYENRGAHIPILQRERLEPIEVINARWLERKGPAAATKGGRGELERARERERRTDHLEEGVE